jgi:hypothetical protein
VNTLLLTEHVAIKGLQLEWGTVAVVVMDLQQANKASTSTHIYLNQQDP